jgi:hypothetical protein
MTRTFPGFLSIVVLITLTAISANAQCDPEAEGVLYQKFLAAYKGSPEQKKIANETGKEYLKKFGECPSEEEKKIASYIKNWSETYEALQIELACSTAVEKTPARAFELCGPYLARDKENLRPYLLMSLAGIKTASSAGQTAKGETVRVARKALDLIRAGKTVDAWTFGGSKDETVAALEFYTAYLTMDTDLAATAATMLTLAKSNTSYSKNPDTYFYLGQAIHKGEVAKLLDAYKTKCSGKETTPECDADFNKIESLIDRVVDAYARAYALSNGKSAAAKAALTEVYKQRHEDSDAGMDQLIAEVLSMPIP